MTPKIAKISLIAAISKDTRAIGKDNKLLFQISDDLKRFKALTLGHPIIMGRKTYESIGRPLPGRKNIVISRKKNPWHGEVMQAMSVENAIETARMLDDQEIFIIGGGQIYDQAIAFAEKLYLTVIDKKVEGDTFFPEYSEFREKTFEEKYPDADPPYSFVELEKK